MNKTVQLVNEWATFEESHPDASLLDFCRYYIVSHEQNQINKKELVGGHIPPNNKSLLLKELGFIMTAFEVYRKAAIAKTNLPFPEAWYILNMVRHAGTPKKTDIINSLLIEYSTGIEGINKLIKAGFLNEITDEQDKRSKLISITPNGEQELFLCFKYMAKVGEMLFDTMNEDSINLVIQLLSSVEIRHTKLAWEVKGKDFDEMYRIAME